MAESSSPGSVDQRGRAVQWGLTDVLLFGLTITATVLIALQFALAGYGAFTMDRSPTVNAYAAHTIVGLAIGLLTLLILAAVVISRSARAHRRSVVLAVALAVLAVAVQPVLGNAGIQVPPLGALHALNGVAIFSVTCWLAIETGLRRAAARKHLTS